MNKSIGLIFSTLVLCSGLTLANDCSNWNDDLDYFKTASVAVVTTCLGKGASPNAPNERGDTPLHTAVRFADDPAIINSLLEAGANPTAADKRGNTPLHEAARYARDSAIITALLEEGADPDAAGARGRTPLHDAVARITDDPAIVTALLEAGADPNAADERGRTPLHHAAEDTEDPTIVASLLEAGADPNATDRHELRPLGFAIERFEPGRDATIVSALLEGGADPNVRTSDGNTPLHHAAASTDGLSTVVALLSAGGDPNAKSILNWKTGKSPWWPGETPLHRAARHADNPATIAVLLDAGADPNARSPDGTTPLHLAGHPRVIQLLLDAGADPNAWTTDGSTPLHRVLSTVGTHLAPAVSTLLEAGADPLARDSDGFSPIHLAAKYAHDPVSIALLLNAGADPFVFNQGWTALSLAAVYNQHYSVAAELMKRHISGESAELLSPLQPGLHAATCWFAAEATWPRTDCYFMVVNQDPNGPLSPTIAFPVIKYSMHPRSDTDNPVLHLGGGGPGVPMRLHTHPGEFWSWFGAMAWSSGRDIYVMDPRGVGMSIPRLNCPEVLRRNRLNLERKMTAIDEVEDLSGAHRDCKKRLEGAGFDLSYYNSRVVAQDVEALRRALNVEKWILFGNSYASRYALTVARDFPDTVEAMILNGAVFPNVHYENLLADNIGSAFDKALARCDRAGTCDAMSLRTRFMDLVRNLDEQPVRVDDLGADISDTYGLLRFVLTGERLTAITFAAFYDESFFPKFRDLVEELEKREFGTFFEALSLWLPLYVHSEDSNVLMYSHYCSESHPFVDYGAAAHNALGAESYVRNYARGWLRDLLSTCDIWGIRVAEAVEGEPIETAIPVLFVLGALDPIVPVEHLEDQLQYFANHSVLIFDDSSHWGSVYGACAMDAAGYFIRHKRLHEDHAICARSK